MELKLQNCCENCGGTLSRISDTQWKCDFCSSVFEDVSVQKQVEELRDLLDNAKREQISNLRRNLFNAVNAQYISSQEIKEVCFAIKEILPDDFQANFYYMACMSNGRTIAKNIRKIEVADNVDAVEQMIKFLIKSMQEETLADLIDLIERAFKAHNMLEKYEQYATWYSREAEKVKAGMYETRLPRDIFVAYSSKDMKQVLELVEVLEDSGFSCFVASRNLRHGKGAVENYNKALAEAMDNCTTFVFVSSENSRNFGCDAVRIEIPYIKKWDVSNAPAELRNKYAAIPPKYKKPRVEFRIAESERMNPADRITQEFFDGYERVYSADEVAMRVAEQLSYMPEEDFVVYEEVVTPAPATVVNTATKICVACGESVAEDSKFCPKCGKNDFVNTIAELIEYKNLMMEQERLERESADRARREQEEKARREREAADRARREQEEKARREADERARREADEKSHREEEERARLEREAPERARQAQSSLSSLSSSYGSGARCTSCGGNVELIFDGHYHCIHCGSKYAKSSNGSFMKDSSPLAGKDVFNKAYNYYNGNGVTQNYDEAMRLYTIAADMGHVGAQNWVGLCYERGHGVAKKDIAEAVRWYRKAAEQGEMYAQRNLGNCYKSGQGITQSYSEAVKWFKKSADQGYAAAQNSLGLCYEKGEGVAQSWQDAVYWYRKAAENGNKEAQRNLGLCYGNGRGVARDYAEAFKWFKKAADQGLASAQTDVGLCYENGQSVAQSWTDAVYWYRKAADQGYMYAQRNLGLCYKNGRGVTQDYAEAFRLFKKAADQGLASAKSNIGFCYEKGQGVTQSWADAVYWYRKAADQGNAAAQSNLGNCYYHGNGVAKDYYEAVRWFRKAADQGNVTAISWMAVCYERGHGLPQSRADAISWYRKAADKGDDYSKRALQRLGV